MPPARSHLLIGHWKPAAKSHLLVSSQIFVRSSYPESFDGHSLASGIGQGTTFGWAQIFALYASVPALSIWLSECSLSLQNKVRASVRCKILMRRFGVSEMMRVRRLRLALTATNKELVKEIAQLRRSLRAREILTEALKKRL